MLGDIRKRVSTRSHVNNVCKYSTFISQNEPNMISYALLNEGWLLAMQEELIQFKQNDVWDLVARPPNKIIIGTRWVFRKKLDENGIITRLNLGYWQNDIVKLKEYTTKIHILVLLVDDIIFRSTV